MLFYSYVLLLLGIFSKQLVTVWEQKTASNVAYGMSLFQSSILSERGNRIRDSKHRNDKMEEPVILHGWKGRGGRHIFSGMSVKLVFQKR